MKEACFSYVSHSFPGIATNAVALSQAEGLVAEDATPGLAAEVVAAVPGSQQKGQQEASGRHREVSRNQCINAEGS